MTLVPSAHSSPSILRSARFAIQLLEHMLKINSSRLITYAYVVALTLFLSACGGGGSSNTTTTPTTPVTVTPTATAISLSTSLTAVASDNSNSSTITATVVNSANAAVSGVPITFSADSGFLSA